MHIVIQKLMVIVKIQTHLHCSIRCHIPIGCLVFRQTFYSNQNLIRKPKNKDIEHTQNAYF